MLREFKWKIYKFAQVKYINAPYFSISEKFWFFILDLTDVQ
jgi:hypothetical protein